MLPASVRASRMANCAVGGHGLPVFVSGTTAQSPSAHTPGKPGGGQAASAGDSAIAQQRRDEFIALCNAMPASRTCAPFSGVAAAAPGSASAPAAPARFEGAWARRALGLYTCADWRSASPALRTRLLARLRRFTGGRIQGDGLLGYGTVLPDSRATALFDSRCAPRYARAFALYKMYGAAAAFGGVSP